MMKRLLAQIGITYFSVLVAAFYLSAAQILILGGICIAAAFLFSLIRKIRKTIYLPAMALAALCACAVNLGYTYFTVQPIIRDYADSPHTIRAVLRDEPYQAYSKNYYLLKVVEADGEKADFHLLLKSSKALEASCDDTLMFTSDLRKIENNYYRSKGTFIESDEYDTSVRVEPARRHSLYYYAIMLRQYGRKALNAYLPKDCAELSRAILLGDKYALDQQARDRFRYAGASYFIVVSGMHFSVICMLFWNLLRIMRVHRFIRLPLIVPLMLVYAAVTGFQMSVIRSGVMMLFTLIGLTIMRQPYPPNHLGIAGILMPLFITPYGAGDIGLILSFYATLSILMWATPISDKLLKRDELGDVPQLRIAHRLSLFTGQLLDIVRGEETAEKKDVKLPLTFKRICMILWNSAVPLFSVSMAANILVFPITVLAFHEFSLVTLLSSFVLYFEVYLILIAALAVCILYWLGPLRYLSLALSWILYALCRIVLWIVTALGSLPFAYFRVGKSFVYLWLTMTILLVVVVILYRNRYRYLPYAVIASVSILLLGCWTDALLQQRTVELEVYSCGSGVCVGLNDRGKLHLLSFDAPSQYVYPLTEELMYRYGKAESALSLGEDDIERYRLYREDEFAISHLLQYDMEGYLPEENHTVTFSGDSVFRLDDDVTLTVSVMQDKAVPYLTVGEESVLIVPAGCDADDIPVEWRTADVVVLSSPFDGVQMLNCRDLIISDTGDFAMLTADILRDHYQRVSFTDRGDVTLRLR